MAKKKNKRKLNKKRFYTFLFVLVFCIFAIYKVFNTKVTNIYIMGNSYFTDQEIIELVGLENYPISISSPCYMITKKLEKDDFILSAKVYKKGFLSKVYIEVKENYPLFYYQTIDKTVLYDGKEVDDRFSTINVINQIPNTVYNKFFNKMKNVDINILNRISEIEYKPNDVDEERFLLYMTDGNYVYLTINKFLLINKYVDVIRSFDNKKGILYLDSGGYFDFFDN